MPDTYQEHPILSADLLCLNVILQFHLLSAESRNDHNDDETRQ